MYLKELIYKYSIFYEIYQKAREKYAYDKENITIYCKELILKEDIQSKDYKFHLLLLSKKDRTWQSSICFSKSEINAYQTYYTHHRYNTKRSSLNLEEKIKASKKEVDLKEILADEKLFSSFVNRLSSLVPYDKDDVEKISDDLKVKILWNFKNYDEPSYIYLNENDFLYSTHKDAKIPSNLDYGYTTLIDECGKYGIIRNKTKLFTAKAEFEVVFDFKYYYLNMESSLVEVQKEEPKVSDDFKDYLCEIVDLDTKEVYTKNDALCNSLDYDNFIKIDKNDLLEYIKIDDKTKEIRISKKYSYIINPIHYAPKAVQDKTTKLWGYINKECTEIISPRFKNYGFFNDGFAVIEENNKKSLINLKGDILIKEKDDICSYEDELFFVKDDEKYAVFKKDKIYIDFIDLNSKINEIKKQNNLNDEELIIHLQEEYCRRTFYFTGEENPFYILLRIMIKNKKADLQKQMYNLPLKEYIALFDTFTSQKSLSEARLLGRSVCVKDCEIIQRYNDVINDTTNAVIGCEYPSSAGMFALDIELPLVFTKKDGESLSLGVRFEYLELIK